MNQDIYTWTEFLLLNEGVDSSAIVYIPSGTTLVFDNASSGSPIDIAGMVIEGEVLFEDGAANPYQINADFILAHNGGTFEIGSEEQPFAGEVIVSLTAEEGQAFDLTSSAVTVASTGYALMPNHADMLEDMIGNKNNNFIMAMGEGSAINIIVDDADKASSAKLDEPVSGGEGINTI